MIRFRDIDILTRMNSVIDTIIILYIGANQFVYARRTHNRHNIRSNDNEEHSPVESHTHAGLDWWTKCATAGSGLGQAPCVHYIILLVAQQSDHAEILPLPLVPLMVIRITPNSDTGRWQRDYVNKFMVCVSWSNGDTVQERRNRWRDRLAANQFNLGFKHCLISSEPPSPLPEPEAGRMDHHPLHRSVSQSVSGCEWGL